MGSIQFALKIFLLHLLLVLCSLDGTGGDSSKEKISAQNGDVLRLPSMDNGMMHREYHMMDHLDPSVRVFFTMNDLKVGKKMTVYFPIKDSSSSPPLLAREEANSIPFSYKHLPYLLHFFSISPESPQAQAMEHTLRECEIKPIKGETKTCATSLESMHDFVHEIFGLETQFRVLSTTHLRKSSGNLDNYTILAEPMEIPVPTMVACHTLPYPYRVFYCHSQKSENKVFMVSLGGDNGGRVEAVAVCHMDTSQWSPNHASFLLLKIEPGTSPVCHFFRADNFIYVPLYV